MMDEMNIKLSTKFMRGIVSKVIARTIRKKLGYKVDIQLHDLDVSVVNGEAKILTSVEVRLDNEEFTKIMKNLVLGEEA